MKAIKIMTLAVGLTLLLSGQAFSQSLQQKNKAIIRAGFERWAKGQGSFFDLLTDDMQWTITGSTPLSKTYTSKKQFLAEVIDPLNQRLSKKITPSVRALYAEGNTVIALIDGKAVAKDDRSYDMSYAWFMDMKDGKIIRVTAFLDGIQFKDVMVRLPGGTE